MSCPVGGPCIYKACKRWGCGKMRSGNVLPKKPLMIDLSKVPDDQRVEVERQEGDDLLDFAVSPEWKP